MELFSKRYKPSSLRGPLISRADEAKDGFLKEPLRRRLQHEVKYIISSDSYLEDFLVIKNKRTEKNYLHKETLRDLSFRELGYNIADITDCENLDFSTSEYRDTKFFDLVELIIIFARLNKRQELIDRLQIIFKEEDNQFVLHDFMIFKRDETSVGSLVPLIKDLHLRNKLDEYYSARQSWRPNYAAMARTSADILQLLFSSPSKQGETKTYTQGLCKKVAAKWTDEKNVKKLSELLEATVKNTKSLNNEISNIRHTDRYTIPVYTPSFYKLIAMENISITELVVLSLPEEFVTSQNPEKIKKNYVDKYGLNATNGWVVKKEEKEEEEEEINVKDIPF